MDDNTFYVPVTVVILLTPQDVDDIMASALDSGISYWCDEAKVVGDYLGEYASDQISRGGELKLHVIDEGYFSLDLKSFKKGFAAWIEDGGDKHCAVSSDGVDCGMIDSVCADEIIQYALFDGVIFS